MSDFKAKMHKIRFPFRLALPQTPLGELTVTTFMCAGLRRCVASPSAAPRRTPCRASSQPMTSQWKPTTTVTDVVGRQRLRSASQQLMVVPRNLLSTVGRRAFAVHGPMVWNSLPDDLRAQPNYESFRQGLKTWIFSSVFSALETFVIIALYKSTFTIPYHTIRFHCCRELHFQRVQ